MGDIEAYAPVSQPSNFPWIEGATVVGLCGFDSREDAAAQIARAVEDGANVIDVHAGLTGDYETFLAPDSALAFISFLADEVHSHGAKIVCYVAGLEVISHDLASGHSALRDHPNWAQRNRDGEPALFDNEAAFWIPEGTEDIWLSPYALDWRDDYMTVIARLSRSGVDAVYMDIPYWMTHFNGWENTWASFDSATVAEFKRLTGLDAYEAKLGDFNDPVFRAWVRFRMNAMDEFVMRVHDTIKAANPDCGFIVELYPSIGMAPVVVGADPYRIIQHCDGIAHEVNPFTVAANRGPHQWALNQANVHALRQITYEQCKPSWMLTYAAYDAWEGDRVAASANLAWSHIILGTTFWESGDVRMCNTTVDETWRGEALNWIREHEDLYYLGHREVAAGYGIYFSPVSRNWGGEDVVDSFVGASMLLIEAGIPYEVVTPRSLLTTDVKVLILPDVAVLDGPEREALDSLIELGVKVVFTGQPGRYDVNRQPGEGLGLAGKTIRIEGTPERDYLRGLAMTEEWEEPREPLPDRELEALRKAFLKKLPKLKLSGRVVELKAEGDVQVWAFRSDGGVTVHLFNTTGLVPAGNTVPTPVENVHLRVAGSYDNVRAVDAFGGEHEVAVKTKRNRTDVTVDRLGRGMSLRFTEE